MPHLVWLVMPRMPRMHKLGTFHNNTMVIPVHIIKTHHIRIKGVAMALLVWLNITTAHNMVRQGQAKIKINNQTFNIQAKALPLIPVVKMALRKCMAALLRYKAQAA